MELDQSNYLTKALGEHVVAQLDVSVRQELEKHLRKKDEVNNDLRSEIERLQEDTRKKVSNMERELSLFLKKLEMTEEFNCNLRKHIADVEARLQDSRKEYFEILSDKSQVSVECDSYKEKMERAVKEKEDLNFLMECKMNEIASLQNEIKQLTLQLKDNSSKRVEVSLKEGEFDLKELHLKQREEQLRHEKELYAKQIRSLNDALSEKSNELTNSRRERAIEVVELKSIVEQKNEEISKMGDEINRMKKIVEEKDKHIDNLAKRIRELQECSVELESQFHNEIAAMNRLIEEHKEETQEQRRRNKQLLETIEEMQDVLLTANKAQTDLEELHKATVLEFQQKLLAKETSIRELKTQLDDTKKQLEETTNKALKMEMESYFPAAASTGKALRSNMSLSQVYFELAKFREKLQKSEDENERLRDQMQQIIKEAEERGPFMYRKIREQQVAAEAVTELRTHLTRLSAESEKIKKERDELQVTSGYLKRQCTRLERENIDLANQVRHLIKSVHEARGFYVQDDRISSSDEAAGQADESATSKVISMHLVTFKDIESLQQQNQRLLSSLRDLGEQQEELEKQLQSSESAKLQQQLDEALKELESLKKDRKHQVELLENIVQNRDPNRSLTMSSARDVTADTSIKSNNSSIAEETLSELKKTIDKLSEEYKTYKDDAHSKVNELNAELIRCREQISVLNVEKTKYSSQLEYLKEKLEISQTNLEQLERLLESKNEKSVELSQKVKKLEEALEMKRQDLLGAIEQISVKDMKIESLKSEVDILKRNEHNLLHERQSVIEQHQEKVQLRSTLEALQSRIEHMEFDSTKTVKLELENALKEVAFSKERLAKDEEQHKQSIGLLEKRCSELQEKLDKVLPRYHQAADELTKTKAVLMTTQQELAILKQEKPSEKVENQEKGTSTERSLQIPLQLKIKDKQLQDLQVEIRSLRDRVNQLMKNYEGQKSLNATLETKLSEQTKIGDERKQAFDKLLSEKVKEISDQKAKLVQQAKQRIAAIMKAKDTAVAEKAELEKKMEEMNKKVVSLEQNKEEAALRLKTLQSQYEAKMRKQEKDLLEAQEANSNNKRQLEKLQSQMATKMSPIVQNVASSTAPSSSTFSAPVVPVVSSATSSAAPPRHPVLPQQQQHAGPKSTPTASIRPYPVTAVSRMAIRSASNAQGRSATVVPVQPTTDDSSAISHSALPQATVTPTQTLPALVVVTPTAVQDINSTTSTLVISAPASPRTMSPATSSVLGTTLELSVAPAADESAGEPMSTQEFEIVMNENSTPTIVPSSSSDVVNPETSSQAVLTETKSSDLTSSQADLIPSETDASTVTVNVTDSVSEAANEASATSASAETVSNEQAPTTSTPLKRHRESPQPEHRCEDDTFKRRKLTEAKAEAEELKACTEEHDSSNDCICIESSDSEGPEDEAEDEGNEDDMDEGGEEEDEEGEEEEEVEDDAKDGETDDEECENDAEGEEDEDEGEGDYDEEESGSSVDDETLNVNQERYEDDYESDGHQESSNQAPEEGDEEEEGEDYGEESMIAEDGSEDADQSQDIQIIEENDPSHSRDEVEPQGVEPAVEQSENVRTTQRSADLATSGASQPTSSRPTFMQAPAPMQRGLSGAVRSEQRLSALGRQSLYLSQAGAFDEGDDGIVPSTPTLCIPRRGEGFVEALNSPRVPQNRFVFAQSTEASGSGLAQLASQGALGVDDTRMDLSQFDNTNNGRTLLQSTETENQANRDSGDVVESETATAVPSTAPQDLETGDDINENLAGQAEDEEDKGDELIIAGDIDHEEEANEGESEQGMATPQVSDDEGRKEASTEQNTEPQQISLTVSQGTSVQTVHPVATSVRFNSPQVARRARTGRASAPAPIRPLQRRPVVWNKDSVSSDGSTETTSQPPPTTITISPQEQQPVLALSQPQTSGDTPSPAGAEGTRGRRIRLRGSRFTVGSGTTRGSTQWRGGRPPRSRGPFH